jgi:carbon starvation protein
MSLPFVAIACFVALALGYAFYGRFVARKLRPDGAAATPATRFQDGVDFVPTRAAYLLPQHFAAIAAAGPIAGPILACSQFGWLPCVIWIVLGVVFIGAVHDFTALFASVRHDARSIAEIMRRNVGSGPANALLAFIWLALVYVVMAFTDVTAATFVGRSVEVAFTGETFDAGGAVAAASTLYLVLALAMGLVQRSFAPRLIWLTLIFVPATLGVVALGPAMSTWLVFGHGTWIAAILGYCFVASLLPVWSLLQPRGYLGGFVLYLALAIGIQGVLFGGFEIRQPAVSSAPFFALEGSAIFPFLFVTIACGACSGFHGLVCSGTTSKQLAKETHCAPIGYGAMLLEGLVAVIALATVMIVAGDGAKGPPGTIYGDGLARFLTGVIGEQHFAVCATFGAMAFSTFVFDTLDVAVRLGRYIVQELLGVKGRPGALLGTAVTVGAPGLLLAASEPGSYLGFWTLFGTSNQLLAALTLLAVTVWLKRTGRPYLFTLLPTIFVAAITLIALALQAARAVRAIHDADPFPLLPLANAGSSLLLLVLAIYVAAASWTRLRERIPPSEAAD